MSNDGDRNTLCRFEHAGPTWARLTLLVPDYWFIPEMCRKVDKFYCYRPATFAQRERFFQHNADLPRNRQDRSADRRVPRSSEATDDDVIFIDHVSLMSSQLSQICNPASAQNKVTKFLKCYVTIGC